MRCDPPSAGRDSDTSRVVLLGQVWRALTTSKHLSVTPAATSAGDRRSSAVTGNYETRMPMRGTLGVDASSPWGSAIDMLTRHDGQRTAHFVGCR